MSSDWPLPCFAGAGCWLVDFADAATILGAAKITGRTRGGLSVAVLEALKKKLADGYFRNPQVTVAVEQYRSQRVFVMEKGS